MMDQDKKMMTVKIFNHVLEIIYLLTGEASILQHLTNSLVKTEVIKNKKLTEKILKHTLQIIYLLTGEEYTIVKKDSLNSSIHQLTGECDINGLKERMVDSQRSLGTFGVQVISGSALKDETMDTSYVEDHGEIDNKDILQVTIQSDLCTGLHNETLYTASINEKGEYEGEVKDIQVVAHPPPSADGFINKNMIDVHKASSSSERMVEDRTSLPCRVQTVNVEKKTPKQSTLCEKGNWASPNESYRYQSKSYEQNKIYVSISSDSKVKKETNGIAPHKDHQVPYTEEKTKRNGEEFSLRSKYLVEHHTTRTQTEGEPSLCPDLGKNITKKSQLVQQHRNYIGDRPYSCSDCDKCFTTRSHLVIHMRTHTGEKPYVCPECGKGFSQKSDLVTHHRTHTGEKPYVCQICGKGSYRRSDLVKHHRTHTGEKPFVCPHCSKGFSERSNLVKHIRTHKREKTYVFH
ncbi:uncharacterized protein O3C94_016778 isoform 2-T2 [Discoglossus pictus]